MRNWKKTLAAAAACMIGAQASAAPPLIEPTLEIRIESKDDRSPEFVKVYAGEKFYRVDYKPEKDQPLVQVWWPQAEWLEVAEVLRSNRLATAGRVVIQRGSSQGKAARDLIANRVMTRHAARKKEETEERNAQERQRESDAKANQAGEE